MAEQKAKLFDRFAEASAGFVSRTPFFVACVVLVVLWAPSFWLFSDVDTWQLVINTATTIITFLMVALLQNSQHRAEQAIHQKLDALADGLADFMEHLGGDQPGFVKDIDDLRRAVGIEKQMVDKHAGAEARKRESTIASLSSCTLSSDVLAGTVAADPVTRRVPTVDEALSPMGHASLTSIRRLSARPSWMIASELSDEACDEAFIVECSSMSA